MVKYNQKALVESLKIMLNYNFSLTVGVWAFNSHIYDNFLYSVCDWKIQGIPEPWLGVSKHLPVKQQN